MEQRRFYSGVFLLTLSTLMLEIIQTRLLSVVTWYHLAFFVISAAMFGMTAGAVWVYLQGDRFSASTLSHDLSFFTSAFAVATGASLLVQMTLAPAMAFSLSAVIAFTELALILATPFFFSGVAVSLALTRSPFPVGRVYAADLAGAALGCLGVLVLMDWTDAPSAILLTGAVAAVAAICFADSGMGVKPEIKGPLASVLSRPRMIFLVLAVLGLANGTTLHGIQPIAVKTKVESRIGGPLYEKWNSFSRVMAEPPGVSPPALWGPSPKLPDTVAEQIYMNIDGIAGTAMVRFDGDLSKVSFLDYDVTNLAYFLKNSGRSAIIGVGSGRDLLSAWRFGLRDLTGVEINPIFTNLLTREPFFAEFAGLSSLKGVRFIVDEARSWFARTQERFDTIQMSMIDTFAATGAGAFTLTENGLYTVEAWQIFINRLTDRGIFTVSRWYSPGEVNETGRLISLAAAALMEAGMPHPESHVFVAASERVATLVLSRSVFLPAELATLRKVCQDYGYRVLASPETEPPASEMLRDILAAPDREALDRYTSGLDLDLTPPTDNRPFFFNLLPLRRPHVALRFLKGDVGVVKGNLIATLTLLTILLLSVVLVAVTIIVPLVPAIREAGKSLAVGGTLYFALLGLGFMLVEMGLLQRLSVFLGHPTYSLCVVLFSLILTTGAGSMLSERARIEATRTRFALWSALLGAYLLALPFWLPWATQAFQSSDIAARASLSVAAIAPAGLMMGFGFPAGMRAVLARNHKPAPWFWGINGAAGVLASATAVALSITFGINVTIILGALCYLALIPPAMVMGFKV